MLGLKLIPVSKRGHRSGEKMDLYVPRVIKDNYKRSFSYMATNLWNQLPTDVKESQEHIGMCITSWPA